MELVRHWRGAGSRSKETRVRGDAGQQALCSRIWRAIGAVRSSDTSGGWRRVARCWPCTSGTAGIELKTTWLEMVCLRGVSFSSLMVLTRWCAKDLLPHVTPSLAIPRRGVTLDPCTRNSATCKGAG
eukprot:CAMPEP_0180410562 /NCGR_PEP_ID=MMETSP0989-20121125/43489_1 /TAXON_ID=697907 /ORGANISM="non described non described, Strain CCMP2293" /LENGTH=126 /DNA_ID=CAMNT_0022414801 /DNA_START=135 /DNA_END=512 /DNA_ORIENTATION=+